MTAGLMFYQDFFFCVYFILAYTYARHLLFPVFSAAILFNLYAIWRIQRRRT